MSTPTPNKPPPPTDEELYRLYEEVRRGFQVDSILETNQSSLGVDVESIIEQYSDAPSSAASQDPPGYNRNMRGPTPPTEKGVLSCKARK